MEDTPTLAVLGVVIAAVGLAGSAIYQAGVLRGRFDKHEALIEKRVDVLEVLNAHRITREEMDARFGELGNGLRDIKTAVRDALAQLKHSGG